MLRTKTPRQNKKVSKLGGKKHTKSRKTTHHGARRQQQRRAVSTLHRQPAPTRNITKKSSFATMMPTTATTTITTTTLIRPPHKFQQFRAFTTETINNTEPSQAALNHLTLERVLTDLQLDALIPTMKSPPELPSLLPLQAQTGALVEQIELYHLAILSSPDFRTLIPNDINRNRLKDYIRHVIHQPLASDGAEPVTMEQFNALMAKFTTESLSTPTTSDPTATTAEKPTTATDAAAAATTTADTTTTTKPTDTTNTTTTTTTEKTTTNPTDATTPPVVSAEEQQLLKTEKELAQATLKSSMTSLNMPSFFDNMTEGTLLEWHVKIGEHFDRGHVLCDIDTDIAELSFEAPEPGHLSEILIHENETTKVGQPIAIMKYTEDSDKL